MSAKPKDETLRRKSQRAALDRLKHRVITPDVKVIIVRGMAHQQIK